MNEYKSLLLAGFCVLGAYCSFLTGAFGGNFET